MIDKTIETEKGGMEAPLLNSREEQSAARDVTLEIGEHYPTGAEGGGHGRNDHIAPVITRGTLLGALINGDETNTAGVLADPALTKLCCACHDLGTEISRDGHNHFGYGIIMGALTPEKIMDVTVKDADGHLARPETVEGVREYLTEEGRLDLSEYEAGSKEEQALIKEVARIEINFDAGYDGIASERLETHICEKYGIGPEHEVCGYIMNRLVNEEGAYKDASLQGGEDRLQDRSERMHELTDLIQNGFGPDSEIPRIAAEATQDHNVDNRYGENGEIEKNQARSIYGMITFDADKSNSSLVELMRNYSFSMENLVKAGVDSVVLHDEKGEKVRDEKGNYLPDVDGVYKNSIEEFEKRHGDDGKDRYRQLTGAFGLDVDKTVFREIVETAHEGDHESLEQKMDYMTRFIEEDPDDPGRVVTRIEAEMYGIQDEAKTVDPYQLAVLDFSDDPVFRERMEIEQKEEKEETVVKKIINLTAEPLTLEQRQMGIYDPADDKRLAIEEDQRFKTLPSSDEMKERAERIVSVAKESGADYGYIAGKPYFNPYLERACRDAGITPVYGFTERISKQERGSETPNKTQIMMTVGFMEPGSIAAAPRIQEKAERLADVAEQSGCRYALIGGAPYLSSIFEKGLTERGITPVYSFSPSTEQAVVMPNGAVSVRSVFEFKGWVCVGTEGQAGIEKDAKILNLTQHDPTEAQIAAGVVEPEDKELVRDLITIRKEDIQEILRTDVEQEGSDVERKEKDVSASEDQASGSVTAEEKEGEDPAEAKTERDREPTDAEEGAGDTEQPETASTVAEEKETAVDEDAAEADRMEKDSNGEASADEKEEDPAEAEAAEALLDVESDEGWEEDEDVDTEAEEEAWLIDLFGMDDTEAEGLEERLLDAVEKDCSSDSLGQILEEVEKEEMAMPDEEGTDNVDRAEDRTDGDREIGADWFDADEEDESDPVDR